MTIRTEKEADYKKIYELVKRAFETAKVSDGDEQDYVEALRRSDRYIPDFALVAEDDGKLTGHIMLTKTFIKTDTEQIECLLLSAARLNYTLVSSFSR
ncbi:MAG: GNAT family N-acetyltransferase [Firmicutes bacterium]|nr:GNAT family N-acetyltransferase [Bacillota bacterium]